MFDRTEAVAKAMTLFWERGYEGTSYDALIQTLGISASSFQNTFGSKEALFQEAVMHYLGSPTAWFAESMDAPIPTREAFRGFLRASAAAWTSGECPSGCMVSSAATQTSPALAPIREFTTNIRKKYECILADRIRRGIREGDMPEDVDPEALAAYYGTVSRGMAIQARDGCNHETLEEVVEYAMRAWPEKSSGR